VKLWDVKGTTRNAVTTTDAVLLLKIDDAIFEFDDCAVSRARTQATRIFAVHALVFAQQPHEVAIVLLVFYKFDQVVVVPLGRRHRLVGVIESRLAKWMIVPFNAGDLTGLTADARGHVDVFADLFFTASACAGHRSGMRRDFLNLKRAWIRHDQAFSIFTRKPLNSGV